MIHNSLLYSLSHPTKPLYNNIALDLLITIQEWLERQDRPGPTDDPPLSALGSDRLSSTETGPGLCVPRSMIGPPLVRPRVNVYLTFHFQLTLRKSFRSWS